MNQKITIILILTVIPGLLIASFSTDVNAINNSITKPSYEIQNYCITQQFGVGDDSQPTATILVKNEQICQPLVTWYMNNVNSSIESNDSRQIEIKLYKNLP